MSSPWIIFAFLCIFSIKCEENLDILIKTRSSVLQKYTEYLDVAIMHFVIPEDTTFSSFKFVAEETDLSIFGCTPRNATIYLQYGSMPVINPDGSKFPESFKNITRPPLYHFEFLTDKTEKYINLTLPLTGGYYVAAFLSYTDPRKKAIKQQGLSQKCYASLNCTVYVRKSNKTEIIIEDRPFTVTTTGKEKASYKILVPESADYGAVTINNTVFGKSMNQLLFSAEESHFPNVNTSFSKTLSPLDIQPAQILFPVEGNKWYYLDFQFDTDVPNSLQSTEPSSLEFSVSFVSSLFSKSDNNSDDNPVDIPLTKFHYSSNLTKVMPYQQFNLLIDGTTDNHVSSFTLKSEFLESSPVPINLTTDEFIALKFATADVTDVGGSLQYILAFKPRTKNGNGRKVIKPEPKENVVIGCISQGSMEIPVWPDKCVRSNGTANEAHLVLNKDDKNETMIIPYPGYGTWYATFRLFCEEPKPCVCSGSCVKDFNICMNDCLNLCNSSFICNSCVGDCKQSIVAKTDCKGCDCDGIHRKSAKICKTSVYFDVSTMPCIQGECGSNGRCLLEASDGVLISTCSCSNRYRGWGCTDDALANPYWRVVLELVLLVLSNLIFLPAVYVAYSREYYVEALCYFSICFFSTFYHACDAGENLINYCITKLSSLQFGDFFCALLAIWVTLMAIANLPSPFSHISHMFGAIVLAFCTTVNKQALWIFVFPATLGVSIIAVSWYLRYRKIRQLFIRKRYIYINMPAGTALVAAGLIIYTALQTGTNYMYLHSMWHIIMAVALLILLPSRDTFHPEPIL